MGGLKDVTMETEDEEEQTVRKMKFKGFLFLTLCMVISVSGTTIAGKSNRLKLEEPEQRGHAVRKREADMRLSKFKRLEEPQKS